MIESLRATVARYSTAYDALPERTADWLRDHEAILEACRARAAVAARRRLEAHLHRASDTVVERLAATGAS
jgi:DNA-binding FadR family transcriptional regulator